jgi:GT2 family glycosyltransferase
VNIDIMLPFYGDVFLMKTAVRSVIAQSDPDWRLTVVDDTRGEGIAEWFESLDDPRVRYLRNPENLGITGNFQRCVDLAEYERVVIMGCDDVMLPNYVHTVRSALRTNPGIGMVQPGVQVIDSGGNPSTSLVDLTKRRVYTPKFTGRRVMGGEELATSVLRGNWLYFPSICWRADAIKAAGFRTGLEVVLDLALVVDLLEAGESMVLDETVCFQYRRHAVSESSLQAFNGRRFAEERNYFLDVAVRMEALGWHQAAKTARSHMSSRLHALTMLPSVLRSGNHEGGRALTRHVFGPAKRDSF